jgi:hypothetical protein
VVVCLSFLHSACCSHACSLLVDSPPDRRGQTARTEVRPVRRLFLRVRGSIGWRGCFSLQVVCRPSAWRMQIVHVAQVARGLSEVKARTVRFSGCTTGGSVVVFGLSARGSWTVRPNLEDRPPGASQSC